MDGIKVAMVAVVRIGYNVVLLVIAIEDYVVVIAREDKHVIAVHKYKHAAFNNIIIEMYIMYF